MSRTCSTLFAVLCLVSVSQGADQEQTLTDLLDTYLRGEYDIAVANAAAQDLGPIRRQFVQGVPAWIGTNPATAGRRGDAAAAFLLELTHARLDTDWHRLKDVIEAVCVNLRASKTRTRFELAWHRASIALAGRARARLWLLGESPQLPPASSRQPQSSRAAVRFPRHLVHGLERFPDDTSLKLARIVAWTWDRDTEPIRNRGAEGDRNDRPTVRGAAPQQQAIAALRALADDPAVGDEALLRTGYMHFSIGQHAEALQAFEQAGRRALSPQVHYLASLLAGRAFDALGRTEPAMRAYEQALDVLPDAESAAVALASLRFVAGDREQSSALLSRPFAQPSAEADPGRLVGYGSYMYWPVLRASLRTGFQK